MGWGRASPGALLPAFAWAGENPLLIPTAKQAHPQVFAISNNLLYVLQELVAVVRSMLLCIDAAGALMCCHRCVRGRVLFSSFGSFFLSGLLSFIFCLLVFFLFTPFMFNPFVPSASVQCFTGSFSPRMPVLSRLPPAGAIFRSFPLQVLNHQGSFLSFEFARGVSADAASNSSKRDRSTTLTNRSNYGSCGRQRPAQFATTTTSNASITADNETERAQ